MNRYGNSSTSATRSVSVMRLHSTTYPNSATHYGMHWGMMNWGGGFIVIPLIISVVVLIDLILVGIWLWKQIKK